MCFRRHVSRKLIYVKWLLATLLLVATPRSAHSQSQQPPRGRRPTAAGVGTVPMIIEQWSATASTGAVAAKQTSEIHWPVSGLCDSQTTRQRNGCECSWVYISGERDGPSRG